jgi:hypothetical protein
MHIILHPVAQYALLAAGLSLCLYLFFTLKCEIGAQEKRRRQAEAVMSETVAAVRAAVEELRAEVLEMRDQTGMLVPPEPAKSGLNLSKRGQVLQMYRRGRSPDQIAAALGLPLSEIELLIKVHRIVLEQVSQKLPSY